jgi:hypothetical protein
MALAGSPTGLRRKAMKFSKRLAFASSVDSKNRAALPLAL